MTSDRDYLMRRLREEEAKRDAAAAVARQHEAIAARAREELALLGGERPERTWLVPPGDLSEQVPVQQDELDEQVPIDVVGIEVTRHATIPATRIDVILHLADGRTSAISLAEVDAYILERRLAWALEGKR